MKTMSHTLLILPTNKQVYYAIGDEYTITDNPQYTGVWEVIEVQQPLIDETRAIAITPDSDLDSLTGLRGVWNRLTASKRQTVLEYGHIKLRYLRALETSK